MSGVLAAIGAKTWWLTTRKGRVAVRVAFLQATANLTDLLLLWTLPKRGISFGPWKSQTVVLAVPRTLATIGLGLASHWIGASRALMATVLVQAMAGIALLWGAFVEVRHLTFTKHEVCLPGLPAESPPIRLLHISDLHVERLTNREDELLRLVRRAEPDLIVITGDYVNLSYNTDPETQRQVRHLLRQLQAPHGVYATLGSPPVDLREEITPLFDWLPVDLLRGEWRSVELGHGRRLALLGMDCSHILDEDAAQFEALMTDAPPIVPRILLYHSPELMPQASEHGIDLYFCGHTHGGQVRLPLIGPVITSSQLGREFVMGAYRRGRTNLFVSRGVGLEGLSAPRVRFLCPPEVTLITLRGARA